MVLIDAELTEQQGKWLGKIAKDLLGTGTVTHTNPFKGSTRQIGWHLHNCWTSLGYSVSAFQDDKAGLGILTQFSLAIKGGPILLLATYWPIRHSPGDITSTKTNVRTNIARLIKDSNLAYHTPLAYPQRISLQWMLTEERHGIKGTILCGDLNAS